MRRRVLITIALSILVFCSADFLVQGRIMVTPSLMFATVTEEEDSFFTTITNQGGRDIQVVVYMAKFTMTRAGFITLRESAAEREAASRIFSLYPQEFILAPGETQRVEVRVDIERASEIEPATATHGVVIFETRPVVEVGMVATVSRIAAPAWVSLPGLKERAGEIVEVFARQRAPDDMIELGVAFKNTGNIHFTPRSGTVIIRDGDGAEVARLLIRPRFTMPGPVRDMHATLDPGKLAVGTYTVEGIITVEEGVQTRIVDALFSVIAPGIIAQPSGIIVDFPPPAAAYNEPIQFQLLFSNTGNVDLSPQGEVRVKDAAGNLLTTLLTTTTQIVPGSIGKLVALLEEGLPAGAYTAIAKLSYGRPEYGGVRTVSMQVEFEVTGEPVIIAGEIIEFAAPTITVGQPIVPILLFKNTGNTDFEVEGLIEIKNAAGRTVGQMPIFRRTVLVGETVDLGSTWEGDLPRGLYRLVATLILAGEKVLTAEASFMVK